MDKLLPLYAITKLCDDGCMLVTKSSTFLQLLLVPLPKSHWMTQKGHQIVFLIVAEVTPDYRNFAGWWIWILINNGHHNAFLLAAAVTTVFQKLAEWWTKTDNGHQNAFILAAEVTNICQKIPWWFNIKSLATALLIEGSNSFLLLIYVDTYLRLFCSVCDFA